MPTKAKIDLNTLAAKIVGAFPKLDTFQQRLSLELYRLIALGQPVPRALLAERVGSSVEAINQILDGWPGVFADSERRVVGYWGLSIPASYASPHKMKIDGRSLSAWCAWDTLFLPELLAKEIVVESTSPTSGATVSLVVTPERVQQADPTDAQVSFLVPDAAGIHENIVNTFCHFVHFFPSLWVGESWVAQHPGTFILSLAEAHSVARRRNELQYGEVLGRAIQSSC